MKYNINWGNGVFAVPDQAADCLKLLKDDKEEHYLKVLLYILKNKITDADMSVFSEIGVPPDKAEEALSFWENVGVFFTGNTAPEKASVPQKEAKASSAERAAQRAKERSAKMLSPEEISKRIVTSDDIKFLFDSAESVFGRILNYMEQGSIIWLHDYYGISSDLILMIMDLAKQLDRANMGFVERTAIDWYENSISTHEQALREIQNLKNYYSVEGQVISRLGISRTLTSKERNFIREWSDKDIGMDLIFYAYEKTVDNTGKVSFSYMNKILAGWKDKGITSLAEAKADSGKKAAKKDKNEHSYDLDTLFEHIVNNTPKINN